MHDLPCGDAAPPLTVAALYRFTRLTDLAGIRAELLEVCGTQAVRGTLLLASEGINGTIAGTADAITAVLDTVRALPSCADLDVKFSTAATMPFGRMKVRIKREIVTLGEPDIDAATQAGQYVEPRDWNTLIADPDVVVIDTRNAYEVAAGTFEGAVDPQTRRPAASATFPRGSAPTAPRCCPLASRARWRCSAPAASAARNRPRS